MKLIVFAATAVTAISQPVLPPQLQGISIEQKLGAQVPLDTQFIDETGQQVALHSLIRNRPIVLALVYYECPMLCSEILSGVTSGLRPLSIRAGRDFDVVAISINSHESPAEALSKRRFYSGRYSGDSSGWHFLVGSEDSIRAVADSVGFHYRYDPKTKMFLHASGVMVITPDGKVARYLYGVNYVPKDLKLALIEASNRQIGSPVDQILLYCYHYDPATGKYGIAVINSLRASSVAVLLAMAVILTILWRRELREGRRVLLKEAPRT